LSATADAAVVKNQRLIALGFSLGAGLAAVGCTPSSAQDATVRDDTGSVITEGEIGAFRIQVGDCLRGIDTGLVASAEGTSCDRSHQYEVYHRYEFPEGDFPGDTIVGTTADTECLAAFEDFVGLNYADSVYGYTALQPMQDSWDRVGDREVLCLIGKYDGSDKTGTARGTSI
jgi:hypothetical protein